MSISFKVHYKKDKKTVKAIKTLEDFIQKASKKFKTQFDCEHYTFQFENDDNKMETVSNEKEYQDYLNSFEFNEGDEYELEAKIKEKKETTKSKEEESNNQNEEDKDVQEGKDIMQMLTQITQFLSVLDNRIIPIEKSIQTLTEKVDRFIENKEQKPKAPKASVTLSKCSIEPITIKGKETKEQEPPVLSFTLLDVEPKEIDMTEIKMRQPITLKLKSNCNTMLVGNKWKLKDIFLKDSLLTFDDVYLPGDIKPQSTFELSIRLNPIKMDVLNSITEKQIEFVAQIKNDITKVCSDNLNILINFRNNDIIRLKETSNNANIQTEQIPMNTFQNRMFQGGNQNRMSNVNQNIGYQGGTIHKMNLMRQKSVSNMNRGYEQSSQNFQKPQEQMNFNLLQNSSSRPYDMQQYQTFSNNTNPNLQNRNSFEYYNGNISNSPTQNNQQQFDKVVNEGFFMLNNYNSASSSSSNLRFSYPSPNSFQPPVQNIQPIMQNVQPPVQNVQPPNNKLEPIQRPPEQEKTSANNLSEKEINKIMTELNEEYYVFEKWDKSDIKDAIIQYNGNKHDIIKYLYSF